MALAGSNRKPALVAAATKVGFSRVQAGKIKDLPWQERAWDVYDKLGSIFYMTKYRTHIAGRFDYFAAVQDTPGEDPNVDATFTDEGDLAEMGQGAKVLEAEGGGALVRRLVAALILHWDVAGEAYLVRFEDAPFWRVLSTQELKKNSGTGFQWMDDDGQPQQTIDRENVYRVWNPHPRNYWMADSPTRHIVEDAEDLILSTREIKARSHSRLPAGILWLPDTVDLSPYAEDEAGTEDDFAIELTKRMTRPLQDTGSADALVPWVITANKEDIKEVRHMTFARDFEISMELRDELRRNIALGLDLPPELGTGAVGDINHWGAWWVSEEAVNTHVLPTVDEILDSLTVNWYRPLLQAAGVDSADRLLWRDVSPATIPPDRSDVAATAFELGAISGKAYRRVIDMDEEDKPEMEEDGATVMDADELIKRINALGILRRAGADWGSANKAVGLPPIELIPGLLPITVKAEEVILNEAPIVAAVEPGAKVSADIPARIDSDLLAWLIEVTHQEIERLVAIAEDAALTAATDPLDESMLTRFAERVDKRIAQAQQKVRAWLSRLIGADITIDGQNEARALGVAAIVKAVLDHVRARLFTPGPTVDPIDLGEIPDVAVPVKQLRDGLSIAGGGLPLFEGEKAWELIGNGKDANDVLLSRGFRTLSYRWEYGLAPRVKEFPPHRALDQREFDSWESPDLTVTSEASWLARPFFKPGDHQGCLCSYTRVLTLSLQLPVAASTVT